MNDDPTLSSPIYKRSDGDSASDRCKLQSEGKESCGDDSASPNTVLAFDPNIMHPQSIIEVFSFGTMISYCTTLQYQEGTISSYVLR